MWRVVSASSVGTSHLAVGIECQDDSFANVVIAPNKPPLLIVFVADGAGSAKFGGVGAELAIQSQ